MQCQAKFLSTLSLRRATSPDVSSKIWYCDFYPRSPCGERPAIDVFLAVWAIISIHALLAESDDKSNEFAGIKLVFLSTLSLRRATKWQVLDVQPKEISIHALLAESDVNGFFNFPISHDISIHALLAESDFQHLQVNHFTRYISIHALLAESDVISTALNQ